MAPNPRSDPEGAVSCKGCYGTTDSSATGHATLRQLDTLGLRGPKLFQFASTGCFDGDSHENTQNSEEKNGGSGGARTREKFNVYAGEAALPSPIASQISVALGQELAQVVTAWEKLPPVLRSGILAMIAAVVAPAADSTFPEANPPASGETTPTAENQNNGK